MNNNVSWRELIEREMHNKNDSFDNIEFSISREENWLDLEFSTGYGAPFTLWTKTRVYFPVQHDNSEWCGSAPRNPCEEIMKHFGA